MSVSVSKVVVELSGPQSTTVSFPRTRESMRIVIWLRVMGSRLHGNDRIGDLLSGIHVKWICFALLLGFQSGAVACVPDLGGVKAGARVIESKSYALIYRTLPEKIEIGKHFAVELALCVKNGAAAPQSLQVDAHMPEHRHGMNYKTVVTARGGGLYRAEGLMFHMPGRWEYIFEVRAGGSDGARERLTASVVLQ